MDVINVGDTVIVKTNHISSIPAEYLWTECTVKKKVDLGFQFDTWKLLMPNGMEFWAANIELEKRNTLSTDFD